MRREGGWKAARVERRRASDQREGGRQQARRYAEFGMRDEFERAGIAGERGRDEARVGRQKELRRLEVERERSVEIAEMEKAIALYVKSLEQYAAQVDADQARAKATEVEETVQTAKATAEAKRQRAVDVEKAQKDAEAEKIAADAAQVRAAVEAEAQRLLNEAENVLTDEARLSVFRRRLLERIEGIVRESVRPMEKIDGINIVHFDGIAGGGDGLSKNPTDEVMESALRYRMQAPLVDSVLKEIGIEGGALTKMGGVAREAVDLQRVATDAEKASKAKSGDTPPAKKG